MNFFTVINQKGKERIVILNREVPKDELEKKISRLIGGKEILQQGKFLDRPLKICFETPAILTSYEEEKFVSYEKGEYIIVYPSGEWKAGKTWWLKLKQLLGRQ